MSDNLARNEYTGDDSRRWELIDGKPVMMARPSVNHNFVAGNIYRLFANYLWGKFCRPFADGTDLYLADGNRFVPDMMIVCSRDKIQLDGVHGAPDLVVEVLSPSTANNDRGTKKKAYEKAGVREYWIVNPADKSVEIWLLKDGVYELEHVYSIYSEVDLQKMEESGEDTSTVVTEFKCSLFDDLVIRLDEVFDLLI